MKRIIVGLAISMLVGILAMAGPFLGFDHYLPGNVSVLYGGFSIEGLKLSVTVGDILGLGGANAFIPIGWESVFIPDIGFGADWEYKALVADIILNVDVALVTPNPVYVSMADVVGTIKFHILPPLAIGEADLGIWDQAKLDLYLKLGVDYDAMPAGGPKFITTLAAVGAMGFFLGW